MNLGPPPVRSHDRRAGTLLDQLSRRHDHVCTNAVDAWQIAAVLESDGITDRVAVQRYGFSDVFELADALFRRVPLRLAPDLTTPAVEQGRLQWEMARGLLFLLSGLMYPLAYRFGALWSITLGLSLGLACGWAASNAVAHLVYRQLGAGSPARAARTLVTGTLVALTVLIGGAAATALWLSVPLPVLAAAAMLITFQLAASALLLLEAEPWLVVAITPGVVVNGLQLVSGGSLVPTSAALGATVATVVMTLTLALVLPRRLLAKEAERDPVRSDWLGALGSFAYGGLTAVLLSVDAVVLAIHSELGLVTAFGASLIPLVLSTGAMQPLLRQLRNEVRTVLATSASRRAYTARVRRSFTRAIGRYSALLVCTSLAALAGLLYAAHSSVHVPVLLAAQVLLGTAMFISLAVVSMGRSVTALAALGIIVALHVVDLEGRWGFLPPHGAVAGYVAACGLYLLLMIPVLLGTVSRAEAIR